MKLPTLAYYRHCPLLQPQFLHFPLVDSIPVTLLFLKHSKHALTSGPVNLLFPEMIPTPTSAHLLLPILLSSLLPTQVSAQGSCPQ